MASRLSVEERRAHLIEAAIGLAERKGVAAITTRDVAHAAGVSLGVVHYCFENKDALMTELVKALSMELRDTVDNGPGVWEHVGAGTDALRNLLRGALELFWTDIEATRDRQLLTYETTTYSLRAGEEAPDKLGIAREQYDFNDATVADIIEKAREATSTTWTVPLPTLSRLTLAILDGVVLRWLVDDDSAAARAQLSVAADAVAAYAAPAGEV